MTCTIFQLITHAQIYYLGVKKQNTGLLLYRYFIGTPSSRTRIPARYLGIDMNIIVSSNSSIRISLNAKSYILCSYSKFMLNGKREAPR